MMPAHLFTASPRMSCRQTPSLLLYAACHAGVGVPVHPDVQCSSIWVSWDAHNFRHRLNVLSVSGPGSLPARFHATYEIS